MPTNYRIFVTFCDNMTQYKDLTEIMKEAELRYNSHNQGTNASIAFTTMDELYPNQYEFNINPAEPAIWKEVLESQAGVKHVDLVE